jgi:lipopolysaccharide transport system permease protein
MPRFPGSFFLQNLIERRSLLAQLVRRDFRQRFVGSWAGWVWGLIHPLVLMVSWLFVFQLALRVPLPEGAMTQNYVLFLFCGFLPWLLFQETVARSATSVVENSNLVTKTVFPSEILPLSVFLSSLIGHALALALAVVAVAAWDRHISLGLMLLPVHTFLLGLLAVGLGWIFGGLQVYLRDTAQVLSVLLTFWFWLTPIFIAEQHYPQQARFLLKLNPMAYLVRGYRERLLSSALPSWEDLLVPAVYSVTVFFLGGLFFRHLKRGFGDVL